MTKERAIRSRCMDCSGGIYQDVKDCEDKACALYPYRTRAKVEGNRARAIKQYCLACVGSAKERKLCEVETCPLHEHRTGKGEDRGEHLPL